MIFTYNDKEYVVVIVKKNNKNTYIRVKEGFIYVTTSYFTTKNSIKKLLEENKNSIGRMIEKVETRKHRQDIFCMLGIPYQVIFEHQRKVVLDRDKKVLIVSSQDMLEKWLRGQAEELFYQHLMYYYHVFEERIPMPCLRVRKMKSRWGVCNTKTHIITLNLELIHYEIECLDYVIIHELSHLLVANHSKDFWSLVGSILPDYKVLRKELKR